VTGGSHRRRRFPRLRSVRALPGAFARSLVRLRRFPPILAAVAGAGAVIGIAAATGPMVVSSAGNAAIESRVGGSASTPAGLRVESNIPLTYDRAQFRLPLLEDRLRGLPLPPPAVTVLGTADAALSKGGKQAPVQMVTKAGFLDHVEVVEGSPGGDGLWVPASAATALGLHPGDSTRLMAGGIGTDVRVAGVYRDIDQYHVPPFWGSVITRILSPPESPPQPPLLLGDLKPFLEAEGGLMDSGTLAADVEVPGDLSLREARRVADAFSELKGAVAVPDAPEFAAFDVVDSRLPALVEEADETVTTTTQPVLAISLAGELAALILAGAAGMFLARRRTVEFGLLSARGTSPWVIGIRTGVEALLPAAAGAAVGLALAGVLTRASGPGGPVDEAAVSSAVARSIIAAVAAAIVVGALTAVAVRLDSPDRAVRGRGGSKAPWELAILGLAAASAYEILSRGAESIGTAVSGGAPGVAGAPPPPKLDLLVLAFPFLFVAGMAGLTVRLLRRALPKVRAAAAGRRPWVFLTAARVAASPRLASIMVLVAGLAIGILTYANVLTASVERTADAKAILSVGTDVVATTGSLPSIPGKAPFEWTPVEIVPAVNVGPKQVDILAIEPSSFAKAAAWVGPFSGPPAALGSLDADGPLPVIVVNAALPANPSLAMSGRQVPVHRVAAMPVFPGVLPARPTLVVDRSRLEQAGPNLAAFDRSFQLWARGDPEVITPRLVREGFDPTFFVSAGGQRDSAGFQALSWTFGLLQTFGALAGVLSVLGAVLYLQARQQQREVTYALARRMGLGRREHRRSIALEIGGMLAAAFVIGAVFATAAALIVHGKVDPLPTLPPGPVFAMPIATLVFVAAAVLVLAWAGAMRVQRKADRANVGELLRRAG
jgi:putative ABC transport system permease protein